MTFVLEACRFELAARRVIQFPAGMAGNVLRGALGKGLREVATREDYSLIFQPGAVAEPGAAVEPGAGVGPSGLAQWPRPFVLRCATLNGRVIASGELFCFGVHLFHMRDSALDLVTRAFAQWADVISVQHEPVAVDLQPQTDPVRRIRVEFQTPTQLKANGQHATGEFSVLLARARDRVSTLRGLYGDGPLEIDFRALAQRAGAVKMVRGEFNQVPAERRSGRTGQRHSIGGLVGFAEYEGDLAEFVSYVQAAAWTGVGRHCAWGNGQIETRILDS